MRSDVARRLAGMALLAAMAVASRATFAAQPDCGPAIERLARSVDMTGHPVAASTCRVWPHDPSILLVAAAYDDDAEGGETAQRRLTLGIAMLSADARRVIAVERQSLEEDATLVVGEGSLRLDTARYDLAPGVRAFGVGIDSIGPGASCPDRWISGELRLYARTGRALRQVFTTYLSVDEGADGAPLCAVAGDGPVVDHTEIRLSVGPGRSHGWADLVSHAVTHRDGDDGWPAGARRVAEHTFHFDGVRYNTDPYAAALYGSD